MPITLALFKGKLYKYIELETKRKTCSIIGKNVVVTKLAINILQNKSLGETFFLEGEKMAELNYYMLVLY